MGDLLASQPNEILVIDYTLLEPSRNGLENILVVTDVFKKYTLALPPFIHSLSHNVFRDIGDLSLSQLT